MLPGVLAEGGVRERAAVAAIRAFVHGRFVHVA
jgi:hypothetical protein